MRVLVTRRLDDGLLNPLRQMADVDVFERDDVPMPRAELLRRVAGVDGLLTMLTDAVDADVLATAGTGLRVVANMAVGYDNIDVDAASARGVVVTNTPDVLTETTADLVFALMLTAARRIPEAERVLRAGEWKTWSPMFLTGQDIHHKTLGLIGFGRIGQAVARRALGFGMRVHYHSRRPKPDLDAAYGYAWSDLDTLLAESDFVVVLVPATPETTGLLDRHAFSRMKPTAVFVNAARGSVVDESALVDALAEQRIYAAGLDVFAEEPLPVTHPLLQLPNVVLLPHIGSASIETRRRMASLAVTDLVRVLSGQSPLHPVPMSRQPD